MYILSDNLIVTLKLLAKLVEQNPGEIEVGYLTSNLDAGIGASGHVMFTRTIKESKQYKCTITFQYPPNTYAGVLKIPATINYSSRDKDGLNWIKCQAKVLCSNSYQIKSLIYTNLRKPIPSIEPSLFIHEYYDIRRYKKSIGRNYKSCNPVHTMDPIIKAFSKKNFQLISG